MALSSTCTLPDWPSSSSSPSLVSRFSSASLANLDLSPASTEEGTEEISSFSSLVSTTGVIF